MNARIKRKIHKREQERQAKALSSTPQTVEEALDLLVPLLEQDERFKNDLHCLFISRDYKKGEGFKWFLELNNVNVGKAISNIPYKE